MNVDLSLSETDLALLSERTSQALFERIVQFNPEALRKHVYTVTEVAQQISYSTKSVREFIREGRTDKTGRKRKLPAREITPGDFRVRPADLDTWLAYF